MEKTGQRKTYRDPALNKIVQEKAAWNKQVSALINDLIHFKKSMNGWPSKYYKERTRITQPVPVDLAGILNQISGEFQDIASRGTSILQEQSDFSKAHLKRHTERTLDRLEKTHGPTETPATPAAPDLTQQISKGLTALKKQNLLVKLAEDFEDKYLLESQASNPFTRFITKLFTSKFGWSEAARIRRLRMELLDHCVKTDKELKILHKEIVKSSKESIINSHKMMTMIWNHWNIVNRLFHAFKALKPGEVSETGGALERPDLAREKGKGGKPSAQMVGEPLTPQTRYEGAELSTADQYSKKVIDYKNFSPLIHTKSPAFKEMNSLVESILATPDDFRINALLKSNIPNLYNQALIEVNLELATRGSSFEQIANELAKRKAGPAKTAQRQLGKLRHQILPGASSGSRLEIYNQIDEVKKDLNTVMDLLEKGFDVESLSEAITEVNRKLSSLRVVMRSLYYSAKPEEASTPFF